MLPILPPTHHPMRHLPHRQAPAYRSWAEVGQEVREVAELMGLPISHAGALVLEMDRVDLEVF